MMENAIILQSQDLTKLIREAVRHELNTIARTTSPAPVQQEGGIDFAVDVLQVYSKSTIYKMTSEGAIPHKKRGRTLWFNRQDLERWCADGATNQR